MPETKPDTAPDGNPATDARLPTGRWPTGRVPALLGDEAGGDGPRPERIAAAARALGAEAQFRLALYADALSDALCREHKLVAWDREQLIGLVQTRLQALREERFRHHGGDPVRIIERAKQPLESIALMWRQLREGRRVRIEYEPGACSAAIELIRGLSRALGRGVLTVADEPTTNDYGHSWTLIGIEEAHNRIALIDEDADRELAAFVLARTCLRRSGLDPRGVKHAFAMGPIERFQAHLQRLWVGARLGPASDSGSFAGPVDEATRVGYREACEAWATHPDVEVWNRGGEVERAGDVAVYLAPAAFCTTWPAPDLPLCGPMLTVVQCDRAAARAAFEEAQQRGAGVIQVGGRRGAYGDAAPGTLRHVRGALLVERLPPGLPEPRPA